MISLQLQAQRGGFALTLELETAEESVAIVGRSGSGKTTLLEAIAGLRPAEGKIAVGGTTLLDSSRGLRLPPERRRIGYVPQDALLFPHLTGRRNVLFSGATSRFDELVEILSLEPLLDRSPETMSGGEQQRVALARALMSEPRLLLLDEPLAGVDIPSRTSILSSLRRLRREMSVPLIYVTHQPEEAVAVARYAVRMEEGRVVDRGDVRSVVRAFTSASGVTSNLLVVHDPHHDPTGGITRCMTAEGMEIFLPWDLVHRLSFPIAIRIPEEEPLLLEDSPIRLSARNRWRCAVRRIEVRGGIAEIELTTPTPLQVRITAEAARELRLKEGTKVLVALRARSIGIIG